MNKEKILEFDVITSDESTLIEDVFKDYLSNEKMFIVNINPEIIMNNYKNEKIREEFNKQKYQIPDGNGIVWASKRHKGKIKKRITGIDLMLKICNVSQQYNSRIYLYGGKNGIPDKACDELKKEYPNINIVGISNGYEEEDKVVKDINSKKTDILFVGMGSPKQEEFIIRHLNELESVKIFMPVGGSFDVISKTKKRAPKWIIKIKLEWLYRAFQEPKRILRQIKLLKFIYLVITEKK